MLDNSYEEEEPWEEERLELIDQIKQIANDKVEKDKKFEKYALEKSDDVIIAFLGPQISYVSQEELLTIQKDIRKYILENSSKILKENMIYLSQDQIQYIKSFPSNGMIEICLEESTIEEIWHIMKYTLLKQIGITFWGYKKDKLVIHIPQIKEIKQYLADIEIMRKNKEFNEKAGVITGICELHGAMQAKQVFHIMEEIYGMKDKVEFSRFLITACGILDKAQIKVDLKNGDIKYIYYSFINEKTAKELIKVTKEIPHYSKEEYIKYADADFIKNTKGYQTLKKQFSSELFEDENIMDMIENIIILYTIKKRLGEDDIDEMIKIMIAELEQLNDVEFPIFEINAKKIEKAFQEIANEFPNWK